MDREHNLQAEKIHLDCQHIKDGVYDVKTGEKINLTEGDVFIPRFVKWDGKVCEIE